MVIRAKIAILAMQFSHSSALRTELTTYGCKNCNNHVPFVQLSDGLGHPLDGPQPPEARDLRRDDPDHGQ